jgi:hypothetical protein
VIQDRVLQTPLVVRSGKLEKRWLAASEVEDRRALHEITLPYPATTGVA